MSGRMQRNIVEHMNQKNCDTVTGLTQCVSGKNKNCMTLTIPNSLKPKREDLINGTEISSDLVTLNNLQCVCPPGKTPTVKNIKQSKGKLDQAVGTLKCE